MAFTVLTVLEEDRGTSHFLFRFPNPRTIWIGPRVATYGVST
jgi:hypothetical protein